jgi:hypothetical protein
MTRLNVRRWVVIGCVACSAVLTSLALRAQEKAENPAEAKKSPARYFEMRTYHAAPGKLDALHARFRDHTMALFKKHGIESIAYWTPVDKDGEPVKDTLIYIVAYPDRKAHDDAWKAFRDDPDWVKAKGDSEKDGPLVEKVDSVFMNPTDYSPMK